MKMISIIDGGEKVSYKIRISIMSGKKSCRHFLNTLGSLHWGKNSLGVK